MCSKNYEKGCSGCVQRSRKLGFCITTMLPVTVRPVSLSFWRLKALLKISKNL
nr:unnamed protein product [Callosobruchus chinensis]